MLPIEQSCFWMAHRPARVVQPLAGSEEADVVILGGGLTGLWTAHWLKRLAPQTHVVLLEQGLVGYGGSGRNAGMLSETIDHGHALAVQHFGFDEAARLARLGESNVRELLAYLTERAIECDYEPTGRYLVALTAAQVEECHRAEVLARSLGLDGFRLLSGEAIRAEVRSPLYLSALEVRRGGILDPVKLVEGLRREAETLGIRIFEKTRVESVEEVGEGMRVHTAGGSVAARRGVLATNAYSHHLVPGLVHRYIPLYDYVLVSAPLTRAQQDGLGWRGRQGITDWRTFFNYYRLTRDNRVLWGTSEAHYWGGNRVDPGCDHSETHYRSLRTSWCRHFPELAHLEWEFAWGGPICSTTRLTPFFGQVLGGRMVFGLGYTGHGLGTTHLAGKILAHMALRHPSDLLELDLVRRRPLPFPPEPIRRLAVSRVRSALLRVDAGERPSLLLRLLDRLGVGFSS